MALRRCPQATWRWWQTAGTPSHTISPEAPPVSCCASQSPRRGTCSHAQVSVYQSYGQVCAQHQSRLASGKCCQLTQSPDHECYGTQTNTDRKKRKTRLGNHARLQRRDLIKNTQQQVPDILPRRLGVTVAPVKFWQALSTWQSTRNFQQSDHFWVCTWSHIKELLRSGSPNISGGRVTARLIGRQGHEQSCSTCTGPVRSCATLLASRQSVVVLAGCAGCQCWLLDASAVYQRWFKLPVSAGY